MAFTKVVGAGIHTQSNIDSHNLNSTGIITATKFDGPFDNIVIGGGGLDISGIVTATELDINGNGDISGNLVVGGNLTANGDFTTLNTTLREVELLRVDASDANLTAGIITQRSTGDILNLSNGSTELFTVVSDGNTGIGTTNPTQKLDVRGDIISYENSSGSVRLVQDGNIEITNNNGGIIDFKTADNEDFDCRIRQVSNGLQFMTGGNGSTDEKVRITSAGRVGIGTTNPNATGLTVYRDDTALGNILSIEQDGTGDAILGFAIKGIAAWQFGIDNDDSDKFKISYDGSGLDSSTSVTLDRTGKVGIGTANPVRPLHIESSDCRIRLTDVGYATDVELQNVSGDAVLTTNGASNLRLQTNNGERFRITKDGQISIDANSGAGTTFGNNTLLNIVPENRTSAFAANDGDTWHDVVLHQGGSATNNAVGIAFVLKNNGSYHKNAGTGICAVKNGTNSDFGSDLVFITRPQSAVAEERLRITSTGNLKVPDDAEIQLGGPLNSGDGDLRIYHTTSGTSWIRHTNSTEYFILEGNQMDFRDYATGVYRARMGAEVKLYYNGNNEKFTTTDTGIEVTGEVAASQDYPNIKPRLNFNFTKEKKLDSRITYSRIGPASFTDEFGKVVLVGDNTPRLNYDPFTGEGKGLLIEQSRTNYVRVSTNLESEWVAGGGSFAVDNSITNPDGSVGAYYHTGTELYHQNIDLSGASTNIVIVSLWVKERSGQSGNLDIEIFQQISGSVISLGAFSFNPATEVVSTADANFSNGTVEKYPNGWYRVSAKVTTSSGNFSSSTRYDMQGAEHYVWGMQLEAGEFLTSFIPTNGDVGTRGLEQIKIDGDNFTDFYNPIESTVVCEFDSSNWLTYNNNQYEKIWSINNGSESDVFEMFKQNTVNNAIRFRVRDGGVNVLGAGNITYGTNTTPKMAFAVKLNDAAVAVDGTIAGTSDTGIPMPTVDRLIFGNHGLDNNANNRLSGHIRKFSYYPVKLPDSQIITLTT